jgi:hypothetical protein
LIVSPSLRGFRNLGAVSGFVLALTTKGTD